MNGKNLSVRDFMAQYGRRAPVSVNDKITVFEGATAESVRDYLSGTGFSDITSMDDLLASRRDAALTMSRDTTNYTHKLFGGGLKGDVANILLNALGIESFYKKAIGNKLPIEGREHARVYDMGDGNVAVLTHTDPGIGNYMGKGVAGLAEAALYHFGAIKEDAIAA
jgi:hypothetical protein